MRDSPRNAIVANVSKKSERGKNFGIIRSMDRLGAVAGTLVCIALFAFLGYKKLLLLAAIPSFIGALLIFFLIKERKTKIKIHKGVALKDISGNFRLFILLSSFFCFRNFQLFLSIAICQ